MQVIGDSPRAARYAGMRTRRKILAVMASPARSRASAARARTATSAHARPRGLRSSATATRASSSRRSRATTRSPSSLVAFLLGGLQNAGYTLQGADFPSGLVGVMQGLILFCALGGELLVRYRIRFGRVRRAAAEPSRVNNWLLVVVLASGVALRDAAPLRRARRAARRAVGRAQPRRRGDDAHRRGDGLLGGAAPPRGRRASRSRRRSAWRRSPARRWR